jgi:hypothetical protein
MCFIKTPSEKIISASGKDSKQLQDNLNIKIHKSFEENPEEIFSMFKPLEYWESKL